MIISILLKSYEAFFHIGLWLALQLLFFLFFFIYNTRSVCWIGGVKFVRFLCFYMYLVDLVKENSWVLFNGV